MAQVHVPVIGIDASRALSERKTGTERYSFELIQALVQLETAETFKLYLNQAAPPAELPALGEPIYMPFPRLWTHLRLSTEMVLHRPDLLFVPSHVVPLIHPRTVVTIHDLGYLVHPEAHPTQDWRMLEWSTRWSTRSAKRVIAISEATKRDLVNHLKLAPDKIDVVYHGISNRLKPAIATETDRIRQRYDLPKRYILTIGTVQPRKNYGRLAAATAILQNQDKEMSLVVAGKRGWMAEQVEQDIFKSGADVRMIDYVDDGDLSALYSGALVYCQPSLYEGFGLPVLEAMACGTPVVAANNSSLPEIGGAAAVYVDETDPTEIARVLMNVLENASLCAELRARGLARAAGFTWEQTARATLDVFRHALSN